jgi:PAS domain S-box-containing protein
MKRVPQARLRPIERNLVRIIRKKLAAMRLGSPAAAPGDCPGGAASRGLDLGAAQAPRRRRLVLTLAAILALVEQAAWAMPAAPAGVLEAGAPSFVVLGPEALGLSTSPTDLHMMPDGRILVVSQNELTFGDGVRWETYSGNGDQGQFPSSVAVGDDGRIYMGTVNGIARIEFTAGDHWRLGPTVTLPPEAASQKGTLPLVSEFADRWYWYGGNGAIVSWRPGATPRVVGDIGAVETMFTLGKDTFVSDESSGALLVMRPDGTSERVRSADLLVSEEVTCAVAFEPGKVLVGTASAGLKTFDGKSFLPFGPPGLLNGGRRITDLSLVGAGFFAASIDTVGIVFFDRGGRTVQVLDRSLDHRLARVRRLQYAREGVLWALLNDGVARVEFPSPISHFEPLLASGLAYADPLRHAGQLWILADGRAMHGVYDANGRLERFSDDTPPGRYLFTVTEVDGQLFGSNEKGIFVYEETGWRLVIPGIVNARIGVAPPTPDGVVYVARGEYGVIQRTGQDYAARRTLFPSLDDSYNSIIDSAGIGWIELGMSKIGRMDASGGKPTLQILGTADGLTSGWVEAYLFEGIARFHLAGHLYRFDNTTRRFVEDLALLARIPQLAIAWGRPITDSSGRLWYTADGSAHVIEGGSRPFDIAPVGFAPTHYTAEDDGIVWMFEKRRLTRMDLKLPRPPVIPVRALITSVDLTASHRQLYAPGGALEPLDYADNSLVIDFSAPADPFASPITFEVLLEGAGTQWVSTGAVGSATFNFLKEGDYLFHVRPVVGGTARGAEARLRFTVRPPWYRTTFAWAIYSLGTLGLFLCVIWLSSHLQRSKRERLEHLVAKRTEELNAINAQLGGQIAETTEKSAALSVSEERYRSLNAQLEDRVQERTAELSQTNDELGQRESLFRLIFEHAPVGISWKRADLGSGYHINPTFRRTLDLPADAMVDSTHFATLVHPEDAPRHAEMNRQIATGETDSFTIEERFVAKGGQVVWGLLSVAVIRDKTGRIVQEIGILENTTARKGAEDELAATHRNLLDASRRAGMAEVATGVLHNVGNVLNSVNVSATLVIEQVRHSKASNVARVAALFDQHKANLAAFLSNDSRGALIPGYLGTLAESLSAEQKMLITELDHLRKNIEHIKDIVAMQQSYARTSGVIETISVPDVIEDVLRLNAGSLARHQVETLRDFQARPVVTTDKHSVMQILVNLVRNAKHACDESGRADKQITVRITSDDRSIKISVIDNGVGIPAENLTRVFNHGFTTRKNGHGFGLHSGALAARALGGSLNVQSDGAGRGATFILELLYKPTASAHENHDS